MKWNGFEFPSSENSRVDRVSETCHVQFLPDVFFSTLLKHWNNLSLVVHELSCTQLKRLTTRVKLPTTRVKNVDEIQTLPR